MDGSSRSVKTRSAVRIEPALGHRGSLAEGSLAGTFVPGAFGFGVIAPPHPLYGGSKDSPVVGEMATALGGVNVATLGFDWRGVGTSAGSPTGDEAKALADYAAALAFHARDREAPCFACGYSFGAAVAIRAAIADPAVEYLVLVAPPASMIDPDHLARFRGRVFLAVGDGDALVDPAALKALVSELDSAHFCLLARTDHFFMGDGLPELGREFAGWLERTLAR